jgi:hypothetical protein
MENIGFGIMCFGEEKYFRGTTEKLTNLTELGFTCHLLTDDPDKFFTLFWGKGVEIIPYNRSYKSYYDKINLVKNIHEDHDIAILLDADLHIKDYNVFDKLKQYDFNEGVSYIDTLWNHTAKFKTVGDIPMGGDEWLEYKKYVTELYPDINNIETIWEYFIVFNKEGFHKENFFSDYEKLQVVKEFCDVKLNKDVSGAGEGVSISASCLKNNINVGLDRRLEVLLKNTLQPITRHTPSKDIPSYLR